MIAGTQDAQVLSDGMRSQRSNYARVMKIVRQNWFWIPLLILIAWTVIPLLWTLFASFKTHIEIYSSRRILPASYRLDSYQAVLTDPRFARYVFNSVYLAITSSVLAVVVCILASYAFARYAFRWRNLLLLIVLVPRILPRASLIVPLYRLIVNLGLLDTYLGLIITYTATAIPLGTWILTGFVAAVPRELEDSAIVDGASLWQRLLYIVVPVAWPGIATILIMSLREAWNEFPFVLAFTSSALMRTLPYQLYLLRETMGITDWSVVNAFTIVSVLPILIAFVVMQRYVVRGIVSGAIK